MSKLGSAMSSDTPKFLQRLSVPRPSNGHLVSLGEVDRPISVFSDFDGTIVLQDTGHILFDRFGLGEKKRQEVDQSIGKSRTFREASEILWGSLNVTLEEAKAELKQHLTIDPDFIAFFDYLQQKKVEFTVISAGVEPLLRMALDTFVGTERSAKINIIANDATVTPEGRWTARWRHNSPLGIDKSLALREWLADRDDSKQPLPKLVFIGDGVSDLAAARQADILFARQKLALESFCIQHMIPYIPYLRFNEVLHDTKYLVKNNRFHDPEASLQYRRSKIAQLTGQLGSLSGTAKFKLQHEDDSDDAFDKQLEHLSLVQRPHTPPGEPAVFRPLLSRGNSVGK